MSQSQAVNPVGLPPPRLRAMVRALRNTSGITTALPTLRTTPPSWSAGSDPASRLKSRWLVAPSAAPSAAADELAEQGSQADLDDVPAEHRDDAVAARGLGELPGEGAEVLRGEDVREGIPEGGEARIAAGRMRQQGGVDFVGALRDGDRFQPGKVRLAVVGHGCSGPEAGFCLAESISLSLRVTWPNENFDCSASMIRRLSSESHMRASAFSAKIPPPLGIRGRTTIASHFFPATPTRSRFSTSTITGLRSGRK